MRPTGETKFGTYLTVIAVAAGIYWCVLFVPIYIDHWQVKDALNEAFNSYRLMSNPTTTRDTIVARFRSMTFMKHTELNTSGEDVEAQGPPTSSEYLKIEYDELKKNLVIRYDYDRVIHMVPTDKIRVVHFSYEKSGDPFK